MYRAVERLDFDFREEAEITDKPNWCRAKLGGMRKLNKRTVESSSPAGSLRAMSFS